MAGLSWLTERPVAHRGLHDRDAGRIENSLTAVRAAVERDFSIEVDLQLSGDGVPMVFHDRTLDRLTGERGPLSALAAAELSTIALSGSADTIPTLGELLTEVRGTVPLFIELKPHAERTGVLAQAVVAALRSYGGPVALMSFDPEMVAVLAKVGPGLPRGIVADATDDLAHYGHLSVTDRFARRHLLHIPRTRPHFIAYDCTALPAPGPLIWRMLLGIPILTWTVRSKAEMRRVRRWAGQIIFEGFDPEDRAVPGRGPQGTEVPPDRQGTMSRA